MDLLGGSKSKPNTINGVKNTQSQQGKCLPWGWGAFKAQQNMLFIGSAQENPYNPDGGGKGVGKGSSSYYFFAPVQAALCSGPVTSIGNVWSNQNWIATQAANESITIESSYVPQNAAILIADNGVGVVNTYDASYTDYGLPADTVLSGSDYAPMTYIMPYDNQAVWNVGEVCYYLATGDTYTCIKQAITGTEIPTNTSYFISNGALSTGEYTIAGSSAGPFTLTGAGNASSGSTTYTGIITGGGSNAFAGYGFIITGFDILANNGEFLCTASTETTLVLSNADGVSDSHAGTATSTPNVYRFSTADIGRDAIVNYQFSLSYYQNQVISTVPNSSIINGDTVDYAVILSTQYAPSSIVNVQYYGEDQENAGVSLSAVSGTPSAAGTYKFIGFQGSGEYASEYFTAIQLSVHDLDEELLITWEYQNRSSIGQDAATLFNFTLYGGNYSQPANSFLSTGGYWSLNNAVNTSATETGIMPGYPGQSLGYSGIAHVDFMPMFLGESGQVSDNLFECVTPSAFGGGIVDANPITCILDVLTDPIQGLGSGVMPFPPSVIDNGVDGTWGGPAGTPGARSVTSTAWDWIVANGLFISPFLDSQNTASSVIGEWLEACQLGAFMSEGLLKIVSYGSTSVAGNSSTWIAPQSYVVALDDTCFSEPEKGKDPINIPSVEDYPDAMNWIQIQFQNRVNQYEDDICYENDPAGINRFGKRLEDPKQCDFIKTLTCAQTVASLRVKRQQGVMLGNQYEFGLPFTYCYLEPMDIVTLTTGSAWGAGLNNSLDMVNRPVRITKIIDDPEKGLAITAEDYIAPMLSAWLNNKSISASSVYANQYAAPGNTQAVIFEPTPRMTGYQNYQLCMGACGLSSNWGSAAVWISYDGENYQQIGTIETAARIGVLDSTFASGSDPDTVNSLVVDLVQNSGVLNPGTDSDADLGVTNCAILDADLEVISYSACTATGDDQYTMNTYIRRGVDNSTIASHAGGVPFVRLDNSIFVYNYDPKWVGQTINIKFQSANTFGNCPELLSTLSAVTFTLNGSSAPTVDASSGLVIVSGPSQPDRPAQEGLAGPLGWSPIASS